MQRKPAKQPISKRNESFLRDILDKVPALVAVYNIRTGEYAYTNGMVKKMLGYPPDAFVRRGYPFVASLVHPDDMPEIMRQNIDALERANRKRPSRDGESIVNFEYRMLHKDGSYRWFHTDGSVFERDESGKVLYVLNVSIDITARRESEEKLKELSGDLEKRVIERTRDLEASEERLRLALDAGKIGAWDWDIVSNRIEWSDRVYEFHGVKKGSFDGSIDAFSKLIHPEDRESVQGAIGRAIADRKGYRVEFRAVRPDGSMRWLLTNGRVLFGGDGKPKRMIGATIDMTERKTLESQKDEFIGIASHELKTPVTSVKLYADVLRRHFSGSGDQKTADVVSKMNSHVDRLAVLINDLLDVTKIEAGKMILSKRSFDLEKLVRETVEDLQRTTDRHVIQVKGGIRKSVAADRDRVGQVLTNLISNAIKYSPKPGRIAVTMSETPSEARVSIRDRGIGIPKGKRESIFDRFFRVDGDVRKTYPGLGLGLYISSEIVKRLGGRIWVESEPGKGSMFAFTVPLGKNRK